VSERLRLVRDFGKLRAGMIVVLNPCGECNGRHRTMLISYQPPAPGPLITGEWVLLPGWQYAPEMSCDDTWGELDLSPAITPLAVERRALFRVTDGLEDSDSAEGAQHRPKPAKKSPGRLPKKERA
jgi:hypothetical protein